jgi:Membrane bound O-acyl transferase family
MPASAMLLPDNSVFVEDEDEQGGGDAGGGAMAVVARNTRVVTPVDPRFALADACASFAFAATATYLLPTRYATSAFFLLPLFTILTGGFAKISSSLAAVATGIPVSAPFSLPWLAPNLASFWAHRWNAPIAYALRAGVYDPLVTHAHAPRAAATMACFLASGAAHVVILAYAAFPTETWLGCFLFFALHGVAVCVERAILDAHLLSNTVQRASGVAFAVLSAWYMFIVCFTADPVFFDRVLRELSTGPRIIANAVQLLSLHSAGTGIAR